MIRDLVKVATKLDFLGLTKEADIVDKFIQKMAMADDYSSDHPFKTEKYSSFWESFLEDPESYPEYWSETLYLEYLGEEGYPTPTEERRKEILEEVKQSAKDMLLSSEMREEEYKRDTEEPNRMRSLTLSDLWMMPPEYRSDPLKR